MNSISRGWSFGFTGTATRPAYQAANSTSQNSGAFFMAMAIRAPFSRRKRSAKRDAMARTREPRTAWLANGASPKDTAVRSGNSRALRSIRCAKFMAPSRSAACPGANSGQALILYPPPRHREAAFAVFFPEGIQKLIFPDILGAGRFANIGIPYPEVMGPFVGIVEIICGALIILGLFTRLAAIPLIVIMIVAIARFIC